MNISMTTAATTLRQNEVVESDAVATAPGRPVLYLVPDAEAPQAQASKSVPFRLRSYLPNAYLSQSRGRRAGSYA